MTFFFCAFHGYCFPDPLHFSQKFSFRFFSSFPPSMAYGIPERYTGPFAELSRKISHTKNKIQDKGQYFIYENKRRVFVQNGFLKRQRESEHEARNGYKHRGRMLEDAKPKI